MKKNIVILLLLVYCSIIFSGCFNYRDIDRAIFATSVIVDIDDENKPIVYVEAYKPVGGKETAGQSGTRIIFKGHGKTIFEAIRNISLASSYKINFSQNKIVIFTRKSAEYGLDNFLDMFDRDQELLIRTFICITTDEAEKLIQTHFTENKYMGIFMILMIDNVGNSSRAVKLSINDYYKQRLIGDRTNVVPIIEAKKDKVGDNKMEIIGGAVVKDDKMVGVIKREEGQGFNFLMDNVKSGTLEPKNPYDESKYLTLEILKSKTKTDIEYDGDRIKLYKTIKVKTSLGEVQKGIEINDRALKEIKNSVENNIEKACINIFKTCQYEKTDIFDLKEELFRKYPKAKVENVIEKTDLILNVDVKINYSVDTMNF